MDGKIVRVGESESQPSMNPHAALVLVAAIVLTLPSALALSATVTAATSKPSVTSATVDFPLAVCPSVRQLALHCALGPAPPERLRLVVPEVCPEESFRVGSQCFFLSEDQKSWGAAVTACWARGGALAEPANTLLLISEVRKRTYDAFFLGGTDHMQEGHWVGVSGRPFNTSRAWGLGEPNSYRGHEDCINVYRMSHRLNDGDCDHENKYVCEMF